MIRSGPLARALFLGFLLTVVTACDTDQAWQVKTINGRSYRYREFDLPITDIRGHILNTSWVETEALHHPV